MHQNGSHMQDKALPKPWLRHASKQMLESETDAGAMSQADDASLRGESLLSGQQLGHYTVSPTYDK